MFYTVNIDLAGHLDGAGSICIFGKICNNADIADRYSGKIVRRTADGDLLLCGAQRTVPAGEGDVRNRELEIESKAWRGLKK